MPATAAARMDTTTIIQAGILAGSSVRARTPATPPMTMMPSSAMLMMPECSLNMPPKATSISTMPYSRVYLMSNSILALLFARLVRPLAAAEELCDLAAEQHREGAQVDDDAADKVGHLGGVVPGRQERAAHRDVGDEQGREDGADGVGAGQQRHRNAVEAHGRQGGGVQGVPLGHAGQIVQPRAKAGQRAGNDHRED